MGSPVLLDLAPSDVHTPAAGESAKIVEGSISADKRKSIPEREFALPSLRKYPIDTAARTRNAAARLEQMHKRGKVSDAEYKAAKARIAAAAKKFGIDSEYNAGKADRRKRVAGSIHVRADLAPGGSVHVRHNMSARTFYDGEGVLLSDAHTAGDAPVWIQIAKTGTWLGHPAGPFELTQKTFRDIIANFDKTRNHEIAIDYEHASEQPSTSGTIPTHGAPAQGWIRELKIEGDGLWGLVYWLPQAREQIRAKQYKYLSPAIRFNTKDRENGKPAGAFLSSAALTNIPFLDGMEPLAAKHAAGAGGAAAGARDLVTMAGKGLQELAHSPHEYMPKIRAALKVHELTPATELSDHLDNLREACMSAGGAVMHEGRDLNEYCMALRDVAGATPGMTLEDVFDRVQDMIDAAIEDHVEEYHEGGETSASMANKDQPGDAGASNARDIADPEKTMPTEAEFLALKNAHTTLETKASGLETEKVTLSGKVTALETENSALTLKLKDATTRADAAEGVKAGIEKVIVCKAGETLEAAVARIVEENKTLLADKDARFEADLQKDVEVAFLTYKDVKKLTDAEKPHMLVLARANREAFNGIYPPVSPEQRALLSNLVPPEARPAVTSPEKSYTALVAKLQSQGMSYTQATIEASKQLQAA